MDDVLHNYTAGEFIEWLILQDLYCLTKDVINEDNEGGTSVIQVLDEEKLKDEFIKSVRKYSVVRRGHTLYIHNNENCRDVMQFHFTGDNFEEISNTVHQTVQALNNRDGSFIGKRHYCG